MDTRFEAHDPRGWDAAIVFSLSPHCGRELELPDILRVKNWSKFQHYKHRRPPWIKFHKSLLDNPDFQCLHVASKALAPMLWLIASEELDGSIRMSPRELSFRLRLPEVDLMQSLKPLIDSHFFDAEGVYASNVLATCLQHATTEYRVQSTEKVKTLAHPTPMSELGNFELFWGAYPRRVGKVSAKRAWVRIPGIEVNFMDVIEGIEKWKKTQQWQDPEKVPYPATFLNDRRWEAELTTKMEDFNARFDRVAAKYHQ